MNQDQMQRIGLIEYGGESPVTLRAAQERRRYSWQIDQENRNVRVESCFVDGHIFGKDVELMDCD